MSFTNLLLPKSAGLNLELGEDAFGSLKSSTGILRDPKMLRERLLEEGYLFVSTAQEQKKLRLRNGVSGTVGWRETPLRYVKS